MTRLVVSEFHFIFGIDFEWKNWLRELPWARLAVI